MENKTPFILISNDDGYQAKGINCLVDMIRDMADILQYPRRTAELSPDCPWVLRLHGRLDLDTERRCSP